MTHTRATPDDIFRIYRQLWGDAIPEERHMNGMNGWTPTIPQETRIKNLIEQIPAEYRARATRECYGADDHEFERNLTSYVMARFWETYPSPIDEAEFTDAWSDERLDNGLTDDTPYRAGTVGDWDKIPF